MAFKDRGQGRCEIEICLAFKINEKYLFSRVHYQLKNKTVNHKKLYDAGRERFYQILPKNLTF